MHGGVTIVGFLIVAIIFVLFFLDLKDKEDKPETSTDAIWIKPEKLAWPKGTTVVSVKDLKPYGCCKSPESSAQYGFEKKNACVTAKDCGEMGIWPNFWSSNFNDHTLVKILSNPTSGKQQPFATHDDKKVYFGGMVQWVVNADTLLPRGCCFSADAAARFGVPYGACHVANNEHKTGCDGQRLKADFWDTAVANKTKVVISTVGSPDQTPFAKLKTGGHVYFRGYAKKAEAKPKA